ncbi:hypothetical protein DM02DRAFT_481598, partial [Periconia macrospinosa]
PTANTPRDACKPCNPKGATTSTTPSFGPDLKNLYNDVLASVKNIHFQKRSSSSSPSSLLLAPRTDTSFCCRESLDCVNVQNLNIPMCYDKFTTNYQFPDGSYGSLTTGDFTSGGSKANLLTGQYSKQGGESGNIYASDSAAKPNTATLSIPPQFTGTGVGSAIPASEIGGVVTSVAASGSASGGATTSSSSGSSPTGSAQSSVGQTGSQGTAAAASTSKGGAAGGFAVDSTRSFGMTIITGLTYVLYAL